MLTVKYLKDILDKMPEDAVIMNEQNESFNHILAGNELRISTQQPIGLCNRTGEYVYPTTTKGYTAFCPELDEDLDNFEWTAFENGFKAYLEENSGK